VVVVDHPACRDPRPAHHGDNPGEIGTGGGITVRSELAEEYAESGWKAERLLSVLDVGGVGCRRPSTPNPVLTGTRARVALLTQRPVSCLGVPASVSGRRRGRASVRGSARRSHR